MAPSALILQWRKDTESGDAEAAQAWYKLADAYIQGDEGLAQNIKLAVKMYVKAAESNHCGQCPLLVNCTAPACGWRSTSPLLCTGFVGLLM